VSITGRDRKILVAVLILALLVGYWFLLLGPKREEASKAATEVAAQQQRVDEAHAELARLEQARTRYASDYSAVVRLGKAIPSAVDTPSLLVQLQDAADGTQIDFDRFEAGQRLAPAPGTAAQPQSLGTAAAQQTGQTGTSTPPGGGPPPAVGSQTQTEESPKSDVGAAREDTPAAREAQAKADKAVKNAVAAGIPVGLEGVPLDFTFRGSFFDLADFFHEMKRFVDVAGKDIRVSGRLMTIDKLKFVSDKDFPQVTAEVTATAFVSPKTQGVTGGASPDGPAESVPAGSPSTPATPAPPAATPTATVKP
jgi:type IV pilus assembly PilO-like protein